jgi:adenylate cyclase
MDMEGAERRLAAILSADVVGYSRLMAVDESATVDAVTAYRGQIPKLVERHRGRVVDFTGDNFLAEFPTATEAVGCAVEIQEASRARNAEVATERRMQLRIGIHLGEVRVEGQQIYGDGVNIAARLEGLAEPGGISISGAVYEQVKRRLPLSFQDQGVRDLKNIPDPIQVYRAIASSVPSPAGDVAASAETAPAVAVLPFVNMSSDPDQEYFADGMSEELINALTQVEGLRVTSRTSAFSFKGTNADISMIGAKLAVASVVEGSVRKAGDRLRITAQLIDVAGGHHLWSQAYDRPLDDVFEIQDEIARTIVKTIKPKLLRDSKAPLVTRPTESQEAYELYLRAADRSSRFQVSDLRTAIEMLRDATALDPDYADAWARLGQACNLMDFFFEPSRDWHERAREALRRAFELDPDNAEAQLTHGLTLWSPRQGFQNAAALRAVGKARIAKPGSHLALLWQSILLGHVGLLDEARAGFEAALEVEPDETQALVGLSQIAFYRGDYDIAQDQMERALALDPTLWVLRWYSSILRLYRGELVEGEADLRMAQKILGDQAILDTSEALLWAKRGEETRAEMALARSLQDRPSIGHDHHRWHHAAAVFATLGRHEEAIAQIRRASQTGLPNCTAFSNDPHFATLRETPAWQALASDLEREDAEFRDEFGHPPA